MPNFEAVSTDRHLKKIVCLAEQARLNGYDLIALELDQYAASIRLELKSLPRSSLNRCAICNREPKCGCEWAAQ